jgi:hypothetical protein
MCFFTYCLASAAVLVAVVAIIVIYTREGGPYPTVTDSRFGSTCKIEKSLKEVMSTIRFSPEFPMRLNLRNASFDI